MKNKEKVIRYAIVLVVMAVSILVLYHHVANMTKANQDNVPVTAVQRVLLKDLTKEYPASPKEVLKFYNSLMECLYNEDYSDDEFMKLADKAKELYDDELLANQIEELYYASLKTEVRNYKDNGKRLTNSWVSASTDVEYYTLYNRECANLKAIYTIREGATTQNTHEIYVLRKDSDGHWKILGWQLES